jgi:hypothetical protein
MPDTHTQAVEQIDSSLRKDEEIVRSIIERQGLHFVLRVCTGAALICDAAYGAVQEFTKRGGR